MLVCTLTVSRAAVAAVRMQGGVSISPAAEVLRDEPSDPVRADFLDTTDAEDPLEPPAPVQRPIPGLFAAGLCQA